MPELCELCGGALRPVYTPEGSERGLGVHLCSQCGLVQSLPRIDRAPRRPASVSGGADWGNIRYGKGFHTKLTLSAIGFHADFAAPLRCLDVGSNRGSFARAFIEAAPQAHVTAIEPDERIAGACTGLERCELIEARIEDTRLEDESFDIVHSCHTIEHLAHPLGVLRDHWRVLRPGGLLALGCPNIELIGRSDMVEEWFIDKHLYHFSFVTLRRMVEAAGFGLASAPNPDHAEDLLLIAVKGPRSEAKIAPDPDEVARAETLVASYRAHLVRNRAALKAVAAEIEAMLPGGVAIWGAGRIFDSLVRQGGLAAEKLTALIDVHLKNHVATRFGCPLSEPESLTRINPKTVIVMSRGFAAEIEQQARALAPAATIIRYSDLLDRALKRPAA